MEMRGWNPTLGFTILEYNCKPRAPQEQAAWGGGICDVQEEQERKAFGVISL